MEERIVGARSDAPLEQGCRLVGTAQGPERLADAVAGDLDLGRPAGVLLPRVQRLPEGVQSLRELPPFVKLPAEVVVERAEPIGGARGAGELDPPLGPPHEGVAVARRERRHVGGVDRDEVLIRRERRRERGLEQRQRAGDVTARPELPSALEIDARARHRIRPGQGLRFDEQLLALVERTPQSLDTRELGENFRATRIARSSSSCASSLCSVASRSSKSQSVRSRSLTRPL